MKLPNETVTKIQSTKNRLTYFTNSLQHLKSRNDVLLVFMSYYFSWFQGWRLTKSTFRTFSFKTFGRIFFHKKTFSVSSSSWCFLLNNFFIGLKHSFKNSLVNFLSVKKNTTTKAIRNRILSTLFQPWFEFLLAGNRTRHACIKKLRRSEK